MNIIRWVFFISEQLQRHYHHGFLICFALKRNRQEVNLERLRKDKHILNIISSKISYTKIRG